MYFAWRRTLGRCGVKHSLGDTEHTVGGRWLGRRAGGSAGVRNLGVQKGLQRSTPQSFLGPAGRR